MGSGNSGRNVGFTRGANDGGYNGGAAYHHCIGDNVNSLKAQFDYRNGYFGDPAGISRNRHIESDNPANEARLFYAKAAYGGVEKPMSNGKGVCSELYDGTVVSMREVSSSDGTPVVEINISRSDDAAGVKKQKIHFVMKRGIRA